MAAVNHSTSAQACIKLLVYKILTWLQTVHHLLVHKWVGMQQQQRNNNNNNGTTTTAAAATTKTTTTTTAQQQQ